MHTEIITTGDGSHTLRSKEPDECYHSTFGAIQESQTVFIDLGYNECHKDVINVLEIGFGTGLNALMTLNEACKIHKKVLYHTVELYPVDLETVEKLNYPELMENIITEKGKRFIDDPDTSKESMKVDFSTDNRDSINPNLSDMIEGYDMTIKELRRFFMDIHSCGWNKIVEINDCFSICKVKTDFTVFELSCRYDIVYFDAFSPEKQPEMWQPEVFERLYAHCNDDAIITTYCAKGAVRRAMQSAGFIVERLPGPPGKREVLRGRKSETY
jgi:tRNA U34 5-methylaminomethyl-2-thiouridine-forming methyltransferase MnmC